MRASLPSLAGLGALVLLASACDALFGIHQGVEDATGGGATTTSSDTATTPTSTTTTTTMTGTGGGAPCAAPGTATCDSGVLSVCDAGGHAAAPVTCSLHTICDPLNQQCSDNGRLSLGWARGCAIELDTSVKCWGYNRGDPQDSGSLLPGDNHLMLPSPVSIPGMKAKQVAVADTFQCALHDTGRVGCWGVDDWGVLGEPSIGQVRTVDPVPGLEKVVEIGVAWRCACARLESGEVDCWGAADNGCAGTASTITGKSLTPTKVPLPAPAVQLAVGNGAWAPVCARLKTGTVACWNSNVTPTEIPGVSGAIDVAASTNAVIVRTSKGVFWSTLLPPVPGDGGPGAYTWTDASNAAYPGFDTLALMSAGGSFCGVQQADGSVLCASNTYPPDPQNGPSPAGQPIQGVPAGPIAEIRSGWGQQDGPIQCVRLANELLTTSVYCWGDDSSGALGIGAPEYLPTKVDVPAFQSPVASLTAGMSAVSAVLQNGEVWYWGHSGAFHGTQFGDTHPFHVLNLSTSNVLVHGNDYWGEGYAVPAGSAPVTLFNGGTAEIGNGRLQTYGAPVFVDARRGYVDLGLLPPGAPTNGQVVAYAADDDGNQCGLFGTDPHTTPTAAQIVPGVSGATALAYQDFGQCSHACAIIAGGAVKCWGNNQYGQAGAVGNPPPSPMPTPTTVSFPAGTKAIVSVAVGSDFSCATDGIAGTGQVYCWGRNQYGQLGKGFTFDYTSPLPAPVNMIGTSAAKAVGVTAYDAMACAWLQDGTVMCWGDNDAGQIGNGTFDAQISPAVVKNLTGVKDVAAGPDFACARTGAGVSCWGSSYWGQGGTGKMGNVSTPTLVMGL